MLLLMMACTPDPKPGDTGSPTESAPPDSPTGADSNTTDSAGTTDSTDSGRTDPTDSDSPPPLPDCPTPWTGNLGDDPGFWTEPGPLAPLIFPTEIDPDDHWELRLATSTNGVDWEPDPRIFAIHLSSLSLLEVGDGLVLNVSVDAALASRHGVERPEGTLVLLATQDLETFASHELGLLGSDTELPVDPSLWIDENGAVNAVYYNYPGGYNDGDPAAYPGDHVVSVAAYDGGCFYEGDDVYAAPNLVDPTICRTDAGSRWLVSTGAAMTILGAEALPGETAFTTRFTWDSYTVPYCRTVPEGVEVLGQTPNGDAGVEHGLIGPDGTFTDLGPLYTEEPFDNCTSPVMWEREGTRYLFCAVWVFDERLRTAA